MNYKYKIGSIYGCKKILEVFMDKDKRTCVKTECVYCGKIGTQQASSIMHSKYNSCVCRTVTHGKTKTRIYRIWGHMLSRCSCKTNDAYKNYGKRGVSVCEEWHKFDDFYNWAYNNGYSDSLTIDRIDNDGNYCPENCRWITLGENVAKSNKENPRR